MGDRFSGGLDNYIAQAANGYGDMLMQIAMGIGEKLQQGVSLIAEAGAKGGNFIRSNVTQLASNVGSSLSPEISAPAIAAEHGLGLGQSLEAAPRSAGASQFSSIELPKDLTKNISQDQSFNVASAQDHGHELGQFAPVAAISNQHFQQQAQQHAMA